MIFVYIFVASGQECESIGSGYNYEPFVPPLADQADDDNDDPVLTDNEIDERFFCDGGLVQVIRASVGCGRRRDVRLRK